MVTAVENSATTSQKLSELTREHLLDTLEPWFYASDFSQKRFDTLIAKLVSQHGEEKILARMDIIRNTIYKYFKDLGQECEVRIEGFTIKITNKFKCGVQTAEMDKALLGLDRSLKTLLDEKDKYLLHDNLLCFNKETLTTLYQCFSSTNLAQESLECRDMIRLSVQESFGLHSKDIVLFLREKLYVRYFYSTKSPTNNDSRRFLGVSPEELDVIYKDKFPADFSDILLEMAEDILNDTLDFNRINNLTFQAKYIEVFRSLVDVAMVEYTDGVDEEKVMALNGYVLRLYFDKLLYLCSELLVQKVLDRNKNADEFLRFYNGEIIMTENGKKLKKPFIVDDKGNVWNFGAILSVMTQCLRYESIHTQKTETMVKLQETYDKAATIAAHHKDNEKICNQQLHSIDKKIDACTISKNNLLCISRPNKEKSNELFLTKEEEKRLLDIRAKAYKQKNNVSLKFENAKIAERNRKKHMSAAKNSLIEMHRSSEVVFKQKDMALRALAKAISFR